MRHVLIVAGKMKGHGKNRKNVTVYAGVHTAVSRVNAGKFLRESREASPVRGRQHSGEPGALT